MLKFYWLEYSYNDHPWLYSLVLYTTWCNFRCYWCHNRKLAWWDYNNCNNCKDKIKSIKIEDYYKPLPEEEIKLAVQNELIDMVIFCWGEFLINDINQIKETITYIKQLNPNIKIRIDTNGTFPEKVEELIEGWYVDWFAIDIKWPYWNNLYYDQIKKVIGIPDKNLEKILSKITQSLELAKQLDYTIYRTVLYPIVEDQEYFKAIKEYVNKHLWKPHYFNQFAQV